MTTPLYARYIPPAPGLPDPIGDDVGEEKHKKRKRHGVDETLNESVEGRAPSKKRREFPEPVSSDEAHPKTKDKKSKKSKKKNRVPAVGDVPMSIEANGNHDTPADRVVSAEEAGNQSEESAPRPREKTKKMKKKKKKKKEKKPKVAQLGSQEESPDAELSGKHKSILSKFHRSVSIAEASTKRSSALETDTATREIAAKEPAPPEGLIPLPQPDPVPDAVDQRTFSALPPWLADPITVAASESKPFGEFEMSAKLVSSLHARSYDQASAIQTAVLPLLLPLSKHTGDLCISATTGSGKTLAYVLPIVESLRHRLVTQLRAIIVVPTRDLVSQVREVCEPCASAAGLRVGTATGNRPLKAEQKALVKKGRRYDPRAWEAAQDESRGQQDEDDMSQTDDLDELDTDQMLPEHVVEYTSAVDVLICTPGRLVEHVQSTPGFKLDDVQWLVIDEADRLLSQSFQEWVEIVMETLQRRVPFSELSMDQKILQRMRCRPVERKVRKVVLSATMSRDVGKLSVLKLQKPTLVVLDQSGRDDGTDENPFSRGDAELEIFEIPATLQESAVSVREEGEKPLYLLRLLQRKILVKEKEDFVLPDASSDPSTSNPSTSSDDGESVPSDDTSSSDASSPSSSDASEAEDEPPADPKSINHTHGSRGVLIFTKSNESAIRLSRLLGILHPPFSQSIGTMTSTQPSSLRRKTLRSFLSAKLSIVVASDLVARGMDMPGLAHVVNYDMPGSAREYVHRVGRTARAGRGGQAWTLVTDREARWFWRDIGRGPSLKRGNGGKVGRVNLEAKEGDDGGSRRYEDALEALGKEVRGVSIQT
ncbi:MAG: ATP-dependent RNA helicase dbp6 [Thelocarpon impressellum]|nr:MAG: ATP-dependent RNA helicase dbp6 [Thelocarpon impressellum]